MTGVFDLELAEDGSRQEDQSDEEYFEADDSTERQQQQVSYLTNSRIHCPH